VDVLLDALPSSAIQSISTDDHSLYKVVHNLIVERRTLQVRQASLALGAKILKPNIDFNPERFKVLQQLGAPFDCRYLAYIVQDILELERLTNTSILSLVKAGNGREYPCVVIKRNAQKSRETIDFVLAHSSMDEGAMAVHLLRRDEDGVIDALKKDGIRIAAGPMPPLTTQAMANLASLGDNSMAMVRRISRLHNGMAMYASQAAVRALSGSQGLEAQCLTAMVEKKKARYSLKRVDNVLLHELSARQDILAHIKTVDVIVSGDFGKGFYRMIALILVWQDNQSNTFTKPVRVPVEIASMRCRKDTKEVLEAIVPSVNLSLENLFNSRVSLQPNYVGKFVTYGDSMFEEGIPIRVYLAGDLMWVADIIGKTNMGSTWCPYCRVIKTTRADPTHTKAALWSIEELQEHVVTIQEGVGPRRRRLTAKEKMGVVRPH
jgi:hypothetical protein